MLVTAHGKWIEVTSGLPRYSQTTESLLDRDESREDTD
jgi:hypothetical protein